MERLLTNLPNEDFPLCSIEYDGGALPRKGEENTAHPQPVCLQPLLTTQVWGVTEDFCQTGHRYSMCISCTWMELLQCFLCWASRCCTTDCFLCLWNVLFSAVQIADPSHVIGLYPNLLPQDFRNQLEYPDTLPRLEGVELENGFLALIEYLTQVWRGQILYTVKQLVALTVCRFFFWKKSHSSVSNLQGSFWQPKCQLSPVKQSLQLITCRCVTFAEAYGPCQGHEQRIGVVSNRWGQHHDSL